MKSRAALGPLPSRTRESARCTTARGSPDPAAQTRHSKPPSRHLPPRRVGGGPRTRSSTASTAPSRERPRHDRMTLVLEHRGPASPPAHVPARLVGGSTPPRGCTPRSLETHRTSLGLAPPCSRTVTPLLERSHLQAEAAVTHHLGPRTRVRTLAACSRQIIPSTSRPPRGVATSGSHASEPRLAGRRASRRLVECHRRRRRRRVALTMKHHHGGPRRSRTDRSVRTRRARRHAPSSRQAPSGRCAAPTWRRDRSPDRHTPHGLAPSRDPLRAHTSRHLASRVATDGAPLRMTQRTSRATMWPLGRLRNEAAGRRARPRSRAVEPDADTSPQRATWRSRAVLQMSLDVAF